MSLPLKNKFISNFINNIEKTITSNNMISSGDSILAGVSGGPDSVALLFFLCEIKKKLQLKIGIAHINHCLRGSESDSDAAFVEKLALDLDIEFYGKKIDVKKYQRENKLSMEESARNVRYIYFEEVCKKHSYNKVALGHNLNDNSELILMYMFRGSGTTGLSGIPPVRDKKIIRPHCKGYCIC